MRAHFTSHTFHESLNGENTKYWENYEMGKV